MMSNLCTDHEFAIETSYIIKASDIVSTFLIFSRTRKYQKRGAVW
jgi:hypothetical protein